MLSLLLLLVAIPALADETDARPKLAPNVLLVMVDDMGYSDLGCYGGEIETPNLDALAAAGLRFSNFYNTGRCWPTRGALLTGYYAQSIRRDAVPGVRSGGRGQRPAWAWLLPRYLQQAGYRSYHSGKWHIDGMPLAEGFDRSYYLRDQGRFFSPQVHWEDDQKLPAVEHGTSFYGTDAIADHAVRCLQEHAARDAEKPFFHYLAFTAPHFPLHALPEDIAKYEGRYDAGWQTIRQQRWKRIQDIGLVSTPLSAVEPDVGPPYDFPDAIKQLGAGEINRPLPWDQLTAQQQPFQAQKMVLHAAMVDRVDQAFGRVLAQVRAMDAWDNTLIFFLSDNGASAEIMVRDDGHDPDAPAGSAGSYLCLGPGWSSVANTPFRRHKTWVHEGGIATPLVVHWPAGIDAEGELRHAPAHVIDLVPTILDVAGVPLPTEPAVPLPGRSLRGVLAGQPVPAVTRWWLHEGNRALRKGDWKLVATKGAEWELYDLQHDRAETRDLAKMHPQRVTELAAEWEQMWQRHQQTAHGKQTAQAP